MISHLSIANLAIIDGLEVEFGDGLNVITGETGAGKSIILGAVGLLMGDRASSDSVRAGSGEAVVEGLFHLDSTAPIHDLLDKNGLEAGDGELILRRIVSAVGRSRSYINGQMVNLSVLSDLGSRLLSVSGQHESQRLIREAEHLDLLDSYADLLELRSQAAAAHAEQSRLQAELDRIRLSESDRQNRLELLRFQLNELAQAQLEPGEDEALEAESQRLKHAQSLAQGAEAIHQALYAADGAVSEVVGQAARQLEQLAGLDPELAPLARRLNDLTYQVEDLGREAGDYGRGLVFDPDRQAEVEDRLSLLKRLIRKYAPQEGLDRVIAMGAELEADLDRLTGSDRHTGHLADQLAEANARLAELAEELSARRKKAAFTLREAVETELAGLSLEGARFEVRIERRPGPIGPDGADQVVFLLSTNPGEPVRPLAKIASGGELSRITLALKTIIADQEAVETVIFDEVDAGIGGRVAEVVGRKLTGLSGDRQVICITHLPQIAAYGRTHLRVVKETVAGRTTSRLEPLDAEARVAEVARMLAGVDLTDRARDHAREMIANAAN